MPAPLSGLQAMPASPRKQGLAAGAAAAAAAEEEEAAGADVPRSPAAAAVAAPAELAVEAQLAELAEPLPEAAAAEASVAAAAATAEPMRRVGGPLAAPAADAEGRVQLRVLLDGSALEVFTGSGEVSLAGGQNSTFAGGAGTPARVRVHLLAPACSASKAPLRGCCSGSSMPCTALTVLLPCRC